MMDRAGSPRLDCMYGNETRHGVLRFSAIGLSHCHFFGHPEPHAPADQAQPHHEVVFLGAVEVRHGVPKETWMDKEAGDTRDRVMLRFSVC